MENIDNFLLSYDGTGTTKEIVDEIIKHNEEDFVALPQEVQYRIVEQISKAVNKIKIIEKYLDFNN